MFVSMKPNKKRIMAFAVLAVAVVGAVFFLRWQKGEQPEPQQFFGETNEERLAFLQSFGWQTEAQASEQREVMIPAEFDDVYQTYNAMQQAQGFDLAPYAGEIVTQYKYHITNYPGETEVFATLLVYGRLIVGGDLACAEVDGFMHGFAKDSAHYGETAPAPESQAESASQGGEVSSSMPESQVESTVGGTEASLEPVDSQPEQTGTEPVEDQVESTAGEADWPTD